MNVTRLNLPTKACHNCRKRRWRCDRSLPSCQKCLSSGVECLGYGKLFVWNDGVASRGKMMGRSYEEKAAKHAIKGDAKVNRTPNSTPREDAVCWASESSTPDTVSSASSGSSGFSGHSGQSVSSSNSATDAHDGGLVLHRPLMDPLVNDFDQNTRYYLDHFAKQLCEVMVVYDVPGQNPIRDLIPAVSGHPSLLQIIIANSAFHIYNISRNPMGHSSYQEELGPGISAHDLIVNRFSGPSTAAYRDALIAKQQALTLLGRSVASINEKNIDLVLVTILMFVNYALVESGRDKWKIHMDGAQKLIMLLGKPPYLQRPMSRLRLTILSDFLVFYILGSTFTFSGLPACLPDTIELDPILRYAETHNYLSCPGPLLRIMIQSFALPDTRHSLAKHISEKAQRQVGSLLQKALDFDPVAWSFDFEPTSPFEDLEQRVRIASAHRSAVCIYLARVLPATNPLLNPLSGSAIVSLTGLADDVVRHISYLKPGDNLFKAICWPLFLAGAESEDPAQREWIMNALDELYSVMYWGYLHTVKRVLEAIWGFKDRAAPGADNCWVEEVRDLGNEILIA